MSTAPEIAIATCSALPDLDVDGPPLVAALASRGITATPQVWDDASVRWERYAAVVIRNTWDYFGRRESFVAWARRVEAVTRLANPAEVIAWNTDKVYLRDLAAVGVPVVPTTWLVPGDAVAWRWPGEVVVKPSVSGGAVDTARYAPGDPAAVAHARALLDAGRTVLVQPYLWRVDTVGETALLYLGGQLSHVVRKAALLVAGEAPAPAGAEQGPYGDSVISASRATRDEQQIAAIVLDALPVAVSAITYARVDLVPSDDGTPLLLELELTEPSMFLGYAPGAAERFADAVAGLLAL